MPAHHVTRVRSQRLVALLAAAAMLTTAGVTNPSAAAAGTRQGTTNAALVADYDLGAEAFTVPGLRSGKNRNGPMELTGKVYYPSKLGRAKHPLILLIHGYWPTCADASSWRRYTDPATPERERVRAANLLNQWPCAESTPPLRSYLGYQYLERALALRGHVVVSIGANGANAIDSYRFQGDEARTALISEQLRLWQQFVEHGRGPLTHSLPHRLIGHVDMRDVGLLGHSRAGRAVLTYASDRYRSRWPAGVTVNAVVGLAPAGGDPSVDYRNTSSAFGILFGNCDDIAQQASRYYGKSVPYTAHPAYQWQVSGANHNFWNRNWSPSSDTVAAYDDAGRDPIDPARCRDTVDMSDDDHFIPQLTEHEQRRYGTTFVGAFFDKSLTGATRHDALLNGSDSWPGVDVTANANTSATNARR